MKQVGVKVKFENGQQVSLRGTSGRDIGKAIECGRKVYMAITFNDEEVMVPLSKPIYTIDLYDTP